ncbi:putative amidoligase enzyme-domain-containing protein [Echria macrotheca]|uniref:Amidoligase enzyme-domain-containing protein n=1 Tax=Echria macrotheca TaxID=438768 RepID=A0AAJ0FD15_9PEZI|nr:putative amidoligase enzyme-domain-containing protein [Echria macrotheca]
MAGSPTPYFGVEMEFIARVRRVHRLGDYEDSLYETKHGLRLSTRAAYYECLAAQLRANGQKAAADRLDKSYRKHPEHYDKWWITKDGSLGNPRYPFLPLEAVSPILNTVKWEAHIDAFWNAWRRVFCTPKESPLCGSHVHVSPGRSKRFTLSQLKSLAMGIVFYEELIVGLLPEERRSNHYCKPNTLHSRELKFLPMVWEHWQVFWFFRHRIGSLRTEKELRDFMQLGHEGNKDRYVLWNFDNVLKGKSGTVEFRGGPGFTSAVIAKRWIAFVVAFVQLCLDKDLPAWTPNNFQEVTDMSTFWWKIVEAAGRIGVQHHLPNRWKEMSETTTSEYEYAPNNYAPCVVTVPSTVRYARYTDTWWP